MKKTFNNRRLRAKLAGRASPGDAPLLDHSDAIDEVEQGLEVLVDDEDRLTLLLEALQAVPDFHANERSEPFGRLVQHDELGVGHQRAPDGEHLLLSAGKLVAVIAAALGEAREEAEHLG